MTTPDSAERRDNRRITVVTTIVGMLISAGITAFGFAAANYSGGSTQKEQPAIVNTPRAPLPRTEDPTYLCEGSLTKGFLMDDTTSTRRSQLRDVNWILAAKAAPSSADFCNSIQRVAIQTGRPDVAPRQIRLIPDGVYRDFTVTLYYFNPDEAQPTSGTKIAQSYPTTPHTEVYTFSLTQATAGQAVINTGDRVVVSIEFQVEKLPTFGAPLSPSCLTQVPVTLANCADPQSVEYYRNLPATTVRLPDTWCTTHRLEGASC